VNRENKLAIIIGFSLVLVVAVLISDHFSRARAVQIGREIKPGTASDFGAAAAGLTRPIGPQDTIPVNAGPLVQPEPRVQKVAETGGAGDGFDDIIMGPHPESTPKAASGAGAGDDAAPSPKEDPATTPDAGVPSKPFSSGEMRTHEIKKGDSLFGIAAKYYGDGTLWKQVAEYNKAKLPKPENLHLGVKLDIPPKDVLMGEAVMPPAGTAPRHAPARENTGGRPKGEKPAAPERGIAGAEKAKTDKSKKQNFETYKIVRGDDLSSIAKRLLGDARRAQELYKLNTDVLEDEHTLFAGTVIKVPVR
jgi:nucleoid-associated protein YgaU